MVEYDFNNLIDLDFLTSSTVDFVKYSLLGAMPLQYIAELKEHP